MYTLLISYIEYLSMLNVFKYITFRSMLAMLTALIFCLSFGEKFISIIKRYLAAGQPIREDGPSTHLSKKGTPTMGGLLMICGILVSILLWADLANNFVRASIFILVAYGVLGGIDDILKVKYKNSKGVSGKIKLLWQALFGFLAVYIAHSSINDASFSVLTFPFFKNLTLDLGYWYIPFAIIVITGASNAVNLTDGLDGLVCVPIAIAAACFGLISYLVGNAIFANYLQIQYIAGTGEIMIIAAAIVGASLGFLWYNCSPASIFMGDVGSLALGGAIGLMSICIKQEILLAIIGGLFVIEAISVILQVAYFKTFEKRIFLMAPIHHHFEKKGWSETKVVVRFWIMAIVFALIGLATLKLR